MSLEFAQSGSLSTPIPTIPWEHMAKSPDIYFDTAVYRLPFALKSPEQLKSEPSAIVALYQYFSTISTSQPFQFLSRKAISEACLILDDEDDEGDEIKVLSTPQPSSSSTHTTALVKTLSQPTHSNPTSANPSQPSVHPNSGRHDPSPSMALTSAPPPTPSTPAQPVTTTPMAAPHQLAETATIPPPTPPVTSVVIPQDGGYHVAAHVYPRTPPVAQKKGKGCGQPKCKPATSKPSDAVGDTKSPPRRASARTINLKRKQMDTEAVDAQPAKKKRTTLKDRWFYEGAGTKA